MAIDNKAQEEREELSMARTRAGYSRRKDGRLQKQFQINGKRYCVYGKTYQECDLKEDRIRASIPVEPWKEKDITLDFYFEVYELKRKNEVKKITAQQVRMKYNSYISPVLGNKRLREIKRKDIIEFRLTLMQRQKALKETTINNIMSILHSIFNEAVVDERIATSPYNGIRGLSDHREKLARDTIHRSLSDEELAIFLKYSEKCRYYNLFKLLLYTGMRAGEGCGLKWSDIDYDKNVIHVVRTSASYNGFKETHSPKTRSGKRDIPMNEQIKQVLMDQRKQSDIFDPKGWIFTKTNGDCPTSSIIGSSVINIFETMKRHNEPVEYFGVHALRDTFATRAVESGMKPETLQKILGHARISMTMDLYYHLSDEKKQEEMQLISIPV